MTPKTWSCRIVLVVPGRLETRRRGLLLVLVTALIATGCARHRRIVAAPAPPKIGAMESGLASWYGYPYHGRRAADGEIYDMNQLTAAHRTLPFGTWVEVRNLTNNKTVTVRITDRGPFVKGRIVDLSRAAAQAIDMIGPGVVRVRLTVIAAGDAVPEQNLFAVQVGAFADQSRAERLRREMEKNYGAARLVLRPGDPPLWRVLVGREPTIESAQALAAQLQDREGQAFVVRLDNPGAPPVGQ